MELDPINETPSAGRASLGWQPIAGWREGPVKLLRKEDVVIGAPGGPLDVHGDETEAALLVNEKITAFNWCTYEGTVGQRLVRLTSQDCDVSLRAFFQSVETPVPPHQSLVAHFAEILALLAAGSYTLFLEEIPADAYVVEIEDEPEEGMEQTGFYAGFGAMIATQPVARLSAAVVERLTADMHGGARPVVLTLAAAGGWCEFIIDGHHKLSAYRRAGIPALRLHIMKRGSERLPLTELLALAPETHALRETFTAHRRANEAGG